ncbi:MAG: hypothetical protein ABMB14_32115, partial [Myxococcota bacterium]
GVVLTLRVPPAGADLAPMWLLAVGPSGSRVVRAATDRGHLTCGHPDWSADGVGVARMAAPTDPPCQYPSGVVAIDATTGRVTPLDALSAALTPPIRGLAQADGRIAAIDTVGAVRARLIRDGDAVRVEAIERLPFPRAAAVAVRPDGTVAVSRPERLALWGDTVTEVAVPEVRAAAWSPSGDLLAVAAPGRTTLVRPDGTIRGAIPVAGDLRFTSSGLVIGRASPVLVGIDDGFAPIAPPPAWFRGLTLPEAPELRPQRQNVGPPEVTVTIPFDVRLVSLRKDRETVAGVQDGRIAVPTELAGTWDLVAHTASALHHATVTIPPQVATVDPTWDPDRAVRFVDAAGAPMPGLSVRLELRQSTATTDHELETDLDGEIRIGGADLTLALVDPEKLGLEPFTFEGASLGLPPVVTVAAAGERSWRTLSVGHGVRAVSRDGAFEVVAVDPDGAWADALVVGDRLAEDPDAVWARAVAGYPVRPEAVPVVRAGAPQTVKLLGGPPCRPGACVVSLPVSRPGPDGGLDGAWSVSTAATERLERNAEIAARILVALRAPGAGIDPVSEIVAASPDPLDRTQIASFVAALSPRLPRSDGGPVPDLHGELVGGWWILESGAFGAELAAIPVGDHQVVLWRDGAAPRVLERVTDSR